MSEILPEMDDPATSTPAVSVIIPCYQAAGHIRESLESALAQSFGNFEVIVINDGSPDTEALEQALEPYQPRITYLKQSNGGPSAARNLGIRHARGQFLAFLDSDDIWMSEYLAVQMKLVEAEPSLDVVFCDAAYFGDPGFEDKTFMQVCPSTGPVSFASLLVETTQLATSGTIAQRSRVLEAGWFDENFRCAEDHDLWLRMAFQGCRFTYQRKVLLRRRIHSDSQGATAGSLVAGEIEVLKKLDQQLALDAASRKLLRSRLRSQEARLDLIRGKQSLLAGDFQNAVERLRQSHSIAPSIKVRLTLLGLGIAPQLMARSLRAWQSWLGRKG